MTAQAAFDFQQPMRTVRCFRCGHRGSVPQSLAMTVTLRCAGCGARAQVGQLVDVGAVAQMLPRRASGTAAALEIFARYGSPRLDDQLDDLFIARAP